MQFAIENWQFIDIYSGFTHEKHFDLNHSYVNDLPEGKSRINRPFGHGFSGTYEDGI